ncbi:MAG: sulfatase [Anaerolineae bacterium]|nr:sulfatase [Anaerolineae bacterium]
MNRRDFLKGALALGMAGLLRPRLSAFSTPHTQSSDQPNIIILVFDTFSAYHTSIHGYSRDTTPHLSRFAQQAYVYHRHYSTGNFTPPGTGSLLTGVYPWEHRAFHINGTVIEPYLQQNLFTALAGTAHKRLAYTHNSLVMLLLDQMSSAIDQYVPTRDLTLFDDLLADRYFGHDFGNAFLGEKLILPKDERVLSSSLFLSLFDRWRRERRIEATRQAYAADFPRGTPRADRHTRYFLLEDAVNWIAGYSAQASDPYLLYAHLYPPHGPYNTRHEFVNVFAQDGYVPVAKERSLFASERDEVVARNRQQYDEFILYTDAEFGRLIAELEREGVLDNSIVLVTSDHGELFERGIFGHITPVLYEPLLRVPMLLHLPGQKERHDVTTPTSVVDILPSLLTLLNQPVPGWVRGRVLPGLSGSGDEGERGRAIYALEAKSSRKIGPLTEATLALIKGDYKLIHYFGYEESESWFELFDVTHDPEELQNLYAPENPVANELRVELLALLDQINQEMSR